MKRVIPTVFACLFVPCWSEEPASTPSAKPDAIPTLEKRASRATLLEKNPDGTLLVSLRPQVYLDELGCTMLSDSEGNTLSQRYHVISFSLGKTRYWTIWGKSPGEGPPVKLDSKKDYKCLIKTLDSNQENGDRPCSILKIWDGDNLIYEHKEKAGQTAAPNEP